MQEIWLPFVNYSNYEISSLGKVRNKKRGHFLNPVKHSAGDWCFNLCQDGKKQTFRLYKALALHFLPNPQKFTKVNIINGNKDDIRIENLKWSNYGRVCAHIPKKKEKKLIPVPNPDLQRGKLFNFSYFKRDIQWNKLHLWKDQHDLDRIFQVI
jgi:hypothetical protein